jgi:hypothetical protein
VLEKTCEVLLDYDPAIMVKANDFMKYHYSSNPELFRDSRKLTNGFFINVQLSANAIIGICERLLVKLDIPSEEWSIEY